MGHRTGGAMSKIKFEKAMLLIEGEFFNQLSWWPEWFPPVNLAVLQSPLKDRDTRAWEHAIEKAVKTGELASTLKPYLWRPPFFDLSKEFDEQLIPCDELTVTASDFAAWLTAQNEKPSEHIAAWFTAVGAQAKDGDNAPAQTAATPAPVETAGAPGGVKPAKAGPAKPLQRTAAQDSAILCEIEKQGYDPLALPKNLPGKAGVKAAIRAALSQNSLFTGETVFNKAWERLTARADIAIHG